MQIIDCQQGTDEWFAARLGKITASKFKDVKAEGEGKTRKTYMINLITEIMEGIPTVKYFDKNMEAGKNKEPEAREYYAKYLTDLSVTEVGFVKLNELVGASPDGLVGEDGLLEIKCPLGTTHIRYVLADKMPTAYYAQVQGQIWVTGRKWCDFLCYRPENRRQPYFLKKVLRDEDYIKELRVKIQMFINEMNELIKTFDPF
jgi:putative phage-type endonuclease